MSKNKSKPIAVEPIEEIVEVDNAEIETEEVEVEDLTVEKEPIKSNDKVAEYCIYIGPTILGVIQKGTIYSGTKKQVLDNIDYAIKKYPAIEMFIIPDEKVAEKLIEIKTPGNLLYVMYNRLVQGKI